MDAFLAIIASFFFILGFFLSIVRFIWGGMSIDEKMSKGNPPDVELAFALGFWVCLFGVFIPLWFLW